MQQGLHEVRTDSCLSYSYSQCGNETALCQHCPSSHEIGAGKKEFVTGTDAIPQIFAGFGQSPLKRADSN